MKKKFLITASALSLSVLLGVGAFFGLSQAKEPVKAEAATYTGSIVLQKNDNDMKYTGSSLVAYFFDSNSHDGWGAKVANDGKTYQQYNWSLNFEPETIIMLRVDTANWSSSDPWNNVWSRTGNVSLTNADVLWMKGTATQYNSDWGTWELNSYVKGGASDSWTVATVDTKLSSVKVNMDGKLEAYGSVSLPANTYFKMYKQGDNKWIGNYSTHSSISSNFTGGGSSNIHNTAAGTYEFYFDFDGESVYITDPVIAAADEWAQDFIEHVGCDSTGVNLPSNWSTFASAYPSLANNVKDYIYATTAVEEGGTSIQYAMWQYDWAVKHHTSLAKFVTNAAGTVRPVNNSMVVNNYAPFVISNNNSFIAIVVISLVGVSTIGAFVYVRTRKHD